MNSSSIVLESVWEFWLHHNVAIKTALSYLAIDQKKEKKKKNIPNFLRLEKLCRYLNALLNKISGVLDIATKQQQENIYYKWQKRQR